jgi:phage terminase large subunit GpA-like protein
MRLAWQPPKALSLSEWADEKRYLPSESAAEPGRWQTSRTEYAREPMDCVSSPDVSVIVIVSAAQLFKTELLLNAIGYFATHDPCPILLLQPTIEMGEAVSKDRITPSIRDTPVMLDAFGDPKSKSSGSTILHKKFTGGHLTITGANSPASLASRPIRVLLCDEIDRYPADAGGEGDPIDLAGKRTTTFWNRKEVLTSSPTITDSSRIWSAFLETDQRYFHIACPRCSVPHRLVWVNVVWGENTPAQGDWKKAMFQCPHCNGFFSNNEKDKAVKTGKWVASAQFYGSAGFQISQLYSPWANSRLEKIVQGFMQAKGNPERMRVWTNTVLGETFGDDSQSVSENDLESRAEDYGAEVPMRVLVLTVGADTQPDRIEAECVGWAAGEESWSIDYMVFHGDTDIPEGQFGSPWDNFTGWIQKLRKHASGTEMRVSVTCIDTGGHNTQAVYNYVKRHRVDRVFGIKGIGGPDKPIIGGPSRKRTGKASTRPIDLYPVGHDAAKGTTMGRFLIMEPGAGYCHFPKGREPEFYRQLTSEKCMTRYFKGRPKREWVKIEGRRNEALDCRCYALAALSLAAPQFERLALTLRRKLEILTKKPAVKNSDPFFEEIEEVQSATDAVENDASSKQAKRKNPAFSRRRGNFVKSW